MNEEELHLVEEGLTSLFLKFNESANVDEKWKAEAVIQARKAIKKVILSLALKGDIKDIAPYIENDRSVGWLVTDSKNSTIRYTA